MVTLCNTPSVYPFPLLPKTPSLLASPHRDEHHQRPPADSPLHHAYYLLHHPRSLCFTYPLQTVLSSFHQHQILRHYLAEFIIILQESGNETRRLRDAPRRQQLSLLWCCHKWWWLGKVKSFLLIYVTICRISDIKLIYKNKQFRTFLSRNHELPKTSTWEEIVDGENLQSFPSFSNIIKIRSSSAKVRLGNDRLLVILV